MTGRRNLLRGALASGAAGLVAGNAAPGQGDGARRRSLESQQSAHRVPFHGAHQAGVLEDARRRTAVVSCDVVASSRREVTDLLRHLTDRARMLSVGDAPPDVGITGPPADSGVLGPAPPSDGPLITVGVGPSLFDERFGLREKKPAKLTPMRTFPNDDLRADWCHGDLSLQVSAADEDTVLHAVRDLTRATRGGLQVRWRMDGFTSPPRPSGTPRNLLGFKDGTANPDPDDTGDMRRLVWAGHGEPDWAAGGTYVVFRLIRMLVEFWDRIGTPEQEQIFGRARDSGAPLDGSHEFDTPHYPRDPVGKVIPVTSHIRRANPRTRDTANERILRRSFNYDRGTDPAGNLDMGLLFSCYQRDPKRQFEAVQERLIDEPLVDYISPFGGGTFFVLPGVRDRADFLGRGLVT